MTLEKNTGLDFVEAQAKAAMANFERTLEGVSDEQLRSWANILNSDLFEYMEKRLDDMLTVMSIRVVNPGKSANGEIQTVEQRGIKAICMEGAVTGANLWRSIVGSIKRTYQRRNAAAQYQPSESELRRSGIRAPSEGAADLRRMFGESPGQ